MYLTFLFTLHPCLADQKKRPEWLGQIMNSNLKFQLKLLQYGPLLGYCDLHYRIRIKYDTTSVVIIMSSSVFCVIKSEIVQSMLATLDHFGMNLTPK